ncbi:MAG: PfkB family carbohydrate kinase, partial [Streptosporangiaceae bacterium]
MTARPVVVVGNLTIDDVIQPDGSSQMGTLGGNTVHAAAAALTWTGEVGVVARCGADFPAAALERLRSAGADTGGIRPVEGPTVRNWVIYEADGTRTWVYRTPRGRSAEVAPQPSDLPAAWLDQTPAPVVHVAAMPLAAAADIVRAVRARAGEAVITLDTHEDWRDDAAVLEAARLVDVFVPSREELAALVGYDDPPRAAGELVSGGVACVVVKLGGDGALVVRPGSPPEPVPAAQVPVLDPTGAGDSFCGGFAAGLALGDDPVAAARRGCATAAAAIGATGSLRLLDRGGLARELLAGGQARPGRAPTASTRRPGQDAYGIETMDREIATIPDVIAAQFADPGGHVRELAGWLADRGIEHLYLTGCGDSAFAGQAASLAFRRHSRLRVHPVHALDFARYDVRYLPPA